SPLSPSSPPVHVAVRPALFLSARRGPRPPLHSFPTRRSSDLDAVAGRERGRQLPDRHLERVVPRDDGGDDAEGLARDNREVLGRSEEHTSELQSRFDLVCRLLLEKKKHTPSSPALRSQSHTPN